MTIILFYDNDVMEVRVDTSCEPCVVRLQDIRYRQACGSGASLAPLLPQIFMIFSGTNSASWMRLYH